jgi:hypothetical protein
MKTQNQITWPTIQQQIDYWNKKEGEELERVSRIQETESRDATNETREGLLRTLKWIRKYPDVLEDPFYTRSIDEVIANAEKGDRS